MLNHNVNGLHLNHNEQHFMHAQEGRKEEKRLTISVNYALTRLQTMKQVCFWDSSAPNQHASVIAIHACYAANQ
jgi:hypothetical protein